MNRWRTAHRLPRAGGGQKNLRKFYKSNGILMEKTGKASRIMQCGTPFLEKEIGMPGTCQTSPWGEETPLAAG